MSTITEFAGLQVPVPAPGRMVVAVVVEWRDKIALLKRSQHLAHDRGRWHCVTGYVDPGASPEEQAFRELLEETGLTTGSYRWTLPGKIARFTNRVSWLDSVLEATGHLVHRPETEV